MTLCWWHPVIVYMVQVQVESTSTFEWRSLCRLTRAPISTSEVAGSGQDEPTSVNSTLTYTPLLTHLHTPSKHLVCVFDTCTAHNARFSPVARLPNHPHPETISSSPNPRRTPRRHGPFHLVMSMPQRHLFWSYTERCASTYRTE